MLRLIRTEQLCGRWRS